MKYVEKEFTDFLDDLEKKMQMRHKIEIDESQRQLIMLALAKLCDERPGWDYALAATAMQFPNGYVLYKEFLDMNAQQVLEAMGTIK